MIRFGVNHHRPDQILRILWIYEYWFLPDSGFGHSAFKIVADDSAFAGTDFLQLKWSQSDSTLDW